MKKIVVTFISLLLIVCIFAGCGTADKSLEAIGAFDLPEFEEEYAYGGAPYEAETMAPNMEAVDTSVASNRKLIRTLNLTVETETYSELLESISQRVVSYGGYIENLNADTRDTSTNRCANLTIRIPVEQLENFAGDVGEISNVVHRSESTQDVTLTYVDLESHRNALKTEQERLMELLENAENLYDILEIENRLTNVRYELESMESQLRTFDNQIEYATIYLDIMEVKVLTPVDEEEKGFWEEIGDGFVSSAETVWEFLKEAFSFLIIAMPYLLLIAAIAGVNVAIVLLIVHSKKKKAIKRAQNAKPIETEKTE